MGGAGSGRRASKATVEGRRCEILPMAFLRKQGLRSGRRFFALFENAASGFWAEIAGDLTGATPQIVLRHLSRVADHRLHHVEYRIELQRSDAPLGGERWWFTCPETGLRTEKLYLPDGERRFLSRQAYGLQYASQRRRPKIVPGIRTRAAR